MNNSLPTQHAVNYVQIITWFLVCVGWPISAYVSYVFGTHKSTADKAEAVFIDVSILIEEGNRITRELERSFDNHEPTTSRDLLWHDFTSLQRRYDSNKTRLEYQLTKYFGDNIAIKVISTLNALYSDLSFRDDCESRGTFSRSIVAYFEIWAGALSETDANAEPGCKWLMMKHCGMNVESFKKRYSHE